VIVKTIYNACQAQIKSIFRELQVNDTANAQVQENTTLTRRRNLVVLLGEFVKEQVDMGVPPKGLEQAFAAKLQISPSLLSQIKKARPIGDKLARQIEVACGVELGSLDRPIDLPAEPNAAELAFVDAARSLWRRSNGKQRRTLLRMMSSGELAPPDLL
jgi:hypothetical protein